MSKKKLGLAIQGETQIDENQLFERIAEIIEARKSLAGVYANREVTMMYWEVGHHINSVILDGGRAAYGKKILTTLSAKLIERYGKSFSERNLYRMMLFASRFIDLEILPTLSAKLSWSHFLELLPLKSAEAQLYYAEESAKKGFSVQDLRRQIKRKGFERQEIANTELSHESTIPLNVFKDPYLLDVFGLKDNYLEADLETAILADIEAFILEFGNGFAFMERQKRIILTQKMMMMNRNPIFRSMLLHQILPLFCHFLKLFHCLDHHTPCGNLIYCSEIVAGCAGWSGMCLAGWPDKMAAQNAGSALRKMGINCIKN